MILSALFPIGVEKFDMEYMKAALLHDIGKLSISKDILQKNGKLTNDEFELIKSHTVAGFHILENKNMFYCAALARSHHERLDGNGYPDGLFDIEITNETKLLSIFDVFSALTLERPYKPSFSVTQAFEMMEKDESQFDQDLFRQFTKNFCINKKRT
jgi:HD-GYP domain-containing protein (c-di-GMP phosphodiesterase class II)